MPTNSHPYTNHVIFILLHRRTIPTFLRAPYTSSSWMSYCTWWRIPPSQV